MVQLELSIFIMKSKKDGSLLFVKERIVAVFSLVVISAMLLKSFKRRRIKGVG